MLSLNTLLEDLLLWRSLYVAGRMHKPVATLQEDPRVTVAADVNRRAAVTAALLLQEQRFTMEVRSFEG